MNKVVNISIVKKVQDELITNCDKRHRLIVGGRGKGASWSIARTCLTWGMKDPLFIVCGREIQNTIADSVKKLLEDTIKLFKLEFFYKVKVNSIVGINGTKFVFHGLRECSADNIKSLEGADVLWIAEAQTISRRTIDIVRPTIRKDNSVVWWDFNPRYETDPVYIDYILKKDPHAKVLWLSWRDNKWFTKALKQEMESDYARNPEEADHIWEGLLKPQGENTIFSRKIVMQAMERKIEAEGAIEIGVDVARFGDDNSSLFKRHGLKTIDYKTINGQDTMKTALMAWDMAEHNVSVPIKVDVTGVGAGVADKLNELGANVIEIEFNGVPRDKDKYTSVADEMWFEFPINEAEIPNSIELRSQLSSRRYDYDAAGRRKIESKKKYKDRLGKSPDDADGIILCYYTGRHIIMDEKTRSEMRERRKRA